MDHLNCTVPSILEFPNVMRHKSIYFTIICLFGSAYLFVILAIVCDEYLIPSMERLCYSLRMPYDVAGCTFLAMATSAPELFISSVGTFVTKGDIGIGAVLGSSVFNLLGIAAVCGILTGVTTKLDWWPITRDTSWYLLSIAVVFFVLLDNMVSLFEAITLFTGYFFYLIGLIFDSRLQKLCRAEGAQHETMEDDPLAREDEPLKSFKETICSRPDEGDGVLMKIWWAIKYPAVILLALTTPSARSIFFLTLLVSVLWISFISYFVTWFLTIVGHNFGISDSIMGLTVLAAGTSMPEIVSSYIVVKKGYGVMAICNAIGSNTFDIFVCLPVPWIIRILVSSDKVQIISTGLPITFGMLFFTAMLLFFGFLVAKFILGKLIGWFSFIAYLIFLVIAVSLELIFSQPPCDIEV